MPFSALVDAMDDHLESCRAELADRLGAAQRRLLGTVFPALDGGADEIEERADHSGIVRLRLYRALRQLVDELAGPDGLALILDDVHWADPGSAEFLDHLVRHPPRGRVLVAVAYRPAQAPPRIAALVPTPPAATRSRSPRSAPTRWPSSSVPTSTGPAAGRCTRPAAATRSTWRRWPGCTGWTGAELPESVRAVLQVELGDLPPDSLRSAHAAAVGRGRVRAGADGGGRRAAGGGLAGRAGRPRGPRHPAARDVRPVPVPAPARAPGRLRVRRGRLAARRARPAGRPPGRRGRAGDRPGPPRRAVLRRSATSGPSPRWWPPRASSPPTRRRPARTGCARRSR